MASATTVSGSTLSLRMTTLMVEFSAEIRATVMCSGATKLCPISLDFSRATSKISLAFTENGISATPLPRLPLPLSVLITSLALWMVIPVFMNPPERGGVEDLEALSSTIRPSRSSSVVTSARPMDLASFWAAITALIARSVKRSKTMRTTLLVALDDWRPTLPRATRGFPTEKAPVRRGAGADLETTAWVARAATQGRADRAWAVRGARGADALLDASLPFISGEPTRM
mmetsp:Transcript_4284/g.15002  ORF Transcript_4284/g.15002 Transcript_4284/m.15002 type:complete len:230 (+) Transcript_4284:3097-3786(+)